MKTKTQHLKLIGGSRKKEGVQVSFRWLFKLKKDH